MAFQQAGGASADMMAKSAALMNKYRSASTAPNLFRMGKAGERNANAQFPIQLSTTDPEDQKWATMQKTIGTDGVGGTRGVIPGVGQAIVPNEFWDYVARKENADLLAQFQQFVLQQVDLSKPESANWWFTRFPWIRDLRLREIDEQADLQKRFAQIQVTGPQNEEDFLLLWMRGQGLIKVASQPLDKLNLDTGIIAGSYRKGFFSPLAQNIPATSPEMLQGNKITWSNPLHRTNDTAFSYGLEPNAGGPGIAGLPGQGSTTAEFRNLYIPP